MRFNYMLQKSNPSCIILLKNPNLQRRTAFMKAYYTQEKIASSFRNFFIKFSNLSKPHLKIISYLITGMISAESVVCSDISRKLKDDFSNVYLESTERRFRRFFLSFSTFAYSFFQLFISHIISNFCVKHSDKNIHISFDHMFCKDKFTILLFSLRIGKQGIPIWLRCFKGKHNPQAYSLDLIKQGISFCTNLFSTKNYHIIFLADRWFSVVDILSYIQELGCFYCIRTKSFFSYSYYNSANRLISKHIRDIKPHKYEAKVLKDVLYTRKLFKTNIVVSNYSNTNEPWYLVTNDDTSRAVRNYSYRFGSIECIFKSQKSNGFRLESTNTQKIEHFISLFTVMCVALVWLTIIGVDYVKSKHNYHIKIRDTRKYQKRKTARLYSFFNLGLTIFNLCYYNTANFTLRFDFILYDV